MTAGSPERDRTMRAALATEGARSLVRPVPVVYLIADLVCPWCYIAFMRLQRALAGSAAVLVWHPFLLNPHLPPRGVTRVQYLERRFGSVAQAHGVHRRVVKAGAKEGIPFAFGAIRAQPNTIPAHALVLAAAAHGRELEAAAALFHAFFVGGANIGEAAVLARIGAEIGLDTDEIATAAGAAAAELGGSRTRARLRARHCRRPGLRLR